MSTQATPEGRPSSLNQPRRILFLDDDPKRAEIFLAENPEAVWVQTAEECIAQLEAAWDEVHLDHDLGGEQFVDLSRDDCGMAVVRWLCLQPHPHLEPTQFLVHSHNAVAAGMMVMQIRLAGYRVESRPFGIGTTLLAPDDPFWNQQPGWHDWLGRLGALARRLIGRREDPDQPLNPLLLERPGPSADENNPTPP
jgi:hypothetical protein